MLFLDQTQSLILAVIFAAWLVSATWLTVRGIRLGAAARAQAAMANRLERLMLSSPVHVLAIDGAGRIDGDPRLAGLLGLGQLPEMIDDLLCEPGLFAPDSAAALAHDIAEAERVGAGFARVVRLADGARALAIRGERADPAVAPDGVLLWILDASANAVENARLADEAVAMRRSIAALSALIEAAPFPMWQRGPDLRLTRVNSAYARAVEAVDPADAVARGIELVEPVGGEAPLAVAARALAMGKPATRTVPATIAGARHMIRMVEVPLGEAGVAGYALDVEELEEARADLNRFTRAQRDLLDNLSAGVAQFGPDQSLAFFNLPFVRMFGLDAERLAQMPHFDRLLEAMRDAERLPEVRDFPGWKAERRGWFALGDAPVEEAWQLPGGTHLRVVAQTLPDGGLLLIFEDRTEELQLASARDTLLQVRAATLDNLFEGICVFAVDGRIQTWNNRFRDLWGLDEAALAAHPRIDAFAEMAAARLASPARASLIRELVRVATTERQQRTGRLAFSDGRHFEVAAVPLPDGNVLFTLLDITASRRIESALRDRNEALEEADRLKNAFVANMSYELRVPLTTIAGFAEMLAGGYAGKLEPAARDYVDAILVSVARLGKVVEDVLDLTQSEAGSLPLGRGDVDMVELLGAVVEAGRPAAAAREQTYVARIDPGLGIVKGDERRLAQAFDHLLRNAIGYTPERGRIEIGAQGDAEQVEVVISDSGPGIPAREQERLFERFSRTVGPGGEREGRHAFGIGLPLARQLIEGHGGTLALSSEPGRGTIVTVRLPRGGSK